MLSVNVYRNTFKSWFWNVFQFSQADEWFFKGVKIMKSIFKYSAFILAFVFAIGFSTNLCAKEKSCHKHRHRSTSFSINFIDASTRVAPPRREYHYIERERDTYFSSAPCYRERVIEYSRRPYCREYIVERQRPYFERETVIIERDPYSYWR